ncbi:MAG: tetraacyldisaccharide 4'-kinase [Alcaligenaceae bacterium]|nr:tetraacyldisaccharide 4'-kinase [Alcaligenaceae bacterium]
MIDTPMKSHPKDPLATQKPSFSHQLQKQWQSGGALSRAFIPLAKLNGAIQSLRKKLYQKQIKRSYRAPYPVIVVGNIYVGGTGKTPVVAAIVQALQDKGWQPGIISRGYGVKIGPAARIAKGVNVKAELIGDEPALLAQYAAIAVHPKRELAIKALLAHYPHTDVIVADDGLQHLALQRDVEIIVQDERGIGNGRLLPAGPLRESATKLSEVDVIITNRNHHNMPEQAHNATQTQTPLLVDMRLLPTAFVNLKNNSELALDTWLSHYQNHSIAAVAGIGNPQRFFNSLAALHITPQKQQAFPDHHSFSREDFEGIDEEIILMTEKDALKCRHWADERFWFLKVRAEFSDPDFFDKIEHLINN